MTGPVRLLTDGRAGNLNPARALARGLAAEGWGPVEAREVRLPGWAAAIPGEAWGALPPGLAARLARALAAEAVAPPWPALVISAGRRAAPFAAALRGLSGGETRAVAWLRPGLPLARFDAVVAPAHDRLAGAVEVLGSLSSVTPEGARAAAGLAWAALPAPRVAVLVGGPSRSARWAEADGRALLEGVAALAASGVSVMVTPSRRTPGALTAALAARLGPGAVWDGAGANPYPGMLGLAEAAVVTAESVNMASEAASAGLPVLVAGVSGLAPKLARFHAAFAAAGRARPFAGRLETWPVAPLDEAGRVARLLAREYLGGGS